MTPVTALVTVIFQMLFLLSLLTLTGCISSGPVESPAEPAGRQETLKTELLKAGAMLQPRLPVEQINIYMVGFHPMKDDPSQQMEAHHYCHQVNEDFAQCVLFDGNTADVNLTGIEYIISELLFETLPEKEKPYWHPHNGEILSGQLVAPGLPMAAEHELMKSKMNSYGKTWHVWHTTHGGDNDPLPIGEPKLAWSFNRFGEVQQGLVESRDQRMGTTTEEHREDRQNLVPLANPQSGVDALRDRFSGPTQPIPGVMNKGSEDNGIMGKNAPTATVQEATGTP